MSLTKLTADLNIIQALDDEPNDVGGLTAAQLKAKFDQAGGAIKTYLNGTLTPELDTALAGKVGTGTTINGHPLSGNVTVTKGDIGLGNVDNTSDANKPVSTAQQAALDAKANKSNVLEKDGTTAFTPTGDYQPATKKYVDDTAAEMALGEIPDGSIPEAKLDQELQDKINDAASKPQYASLCPVWAYTESTTFTAPYTGEYRVVVIGKGGDGGAGGADGNPSGITYVELIGGSGGGSGAIGIGKFTFTANETHNISITDTESDFSDGKIIAGAGGNGANGAAERSFNSQPSLPPRAGGAGGVISGTAVLIGQNGSAGAGTTQVSTKTTAGGKGGALSFAAFAPFIYGGKLGVNLTPVVDGRAPTATANSATTTGEIPLGGLVGCGGDGAGTAYKANGTSGGSSSTSTGIGGKGGPGAVIIEFLG